MANFQFFLGKVVFWVLLEHGRLLLPSFCAFLMVLHLS